MATIPELPLLAALILLLAATACDAEVEELDDRTRPAPMPAPNEGITPHRAERPGSLMSGYLAQGGEEDLVLSSENGRYLFERNKDDEFQDPVPDGRWVLPGALIDAVGTSGGDDGLLAVTTTLTIGDGPVQPVAFEEVRVAKGTGGGAVLSSATVKQGGATLEVSTRAVLARDLPHLVLITEVVNKGKQPVKVGTGDRMRFGPGPVFTGGKGPQTSPGRSRVPFIAHESSPEAYAYTVDGTSSFDAALHVADRGTRSATMAVDALSPTKTLTSGQSMEYVRRFCASGKGMPGVRAWLAGLGGKKVGTIRGKITAPRSLDPQSFTLALYQGNRFFGHLPLESDFAIDTPIPAGSYRLETLGPWGLKGPTKTLDVKGGGTSRVEFDVGGLDKVLVKITDKRGKTLGGKLVVTTKDGKPVMLGVDGKGPNAGPYLHLPEGTGELWLPPGTYRVTATRGPEYTIHGQELEVQRGRDDMRLTATLEKKLDTTGLLMADLRSYSQKDSVGFAPLDQLTAAMASSGVEYAVVTDRVSPTWMNDAATSIGLQLVTRSVPGFEATPIWPHFGTFTLMPAGNPGAGRDGSPVAGNDPEEFLTLLRNLGSGKPFVSVTWPRAPSKTGYFDIYNLDRDTGLFTRQGGSYNFDGVELLGGGGVATPCLFTDPEKCSGDEGRIAQSLDDASRDWSALVTQGYRFTATASSGSARLGLEPVGMPFTWIDVGRRKDDTRSLDPLEPIQALRDGRAVISTGPVIRFTIENRDMGQLAPGLKRIRKKDKVIVIRNARVRIEAESMRWARFDEVVLYEDGKAIESWEVDQVIKDDRITFEATVDVKPKRDSWYHVRVYGKKPIPTIPHIRVRPFAMTNPIWVEGDGDGKWERELDGNLKELQ